MNFIKGNSNNSSANELSNKFRHFLTPRRHSGLKYSILKLEVVISELAPTFAAATHFSSSALHCSSIRANNGKITSTIDEHSLIDIGGLSSYLL